MQENNFEENVSRTMEDFTIKPSEAVWQKIQPQIAAKEKRRRVIVVFSILIIALLAGIIIFDALPHKESIIPEAAATNQAEQNARESATEKNKATEKNETATSSVITPSTTSGKTNPANEIALQNSSENKTANKPQKKNNHKLYKKAAVNMTTVVPEIEEVISNPPVTVEPGIAVTDPGTNKKFPSIGNGDVKEVTVAEVKKEEKKQEEKPVVLPAKNNKQENKSNRKWKLAVNFWAGYAATGQSYFSSKDDGAANYSSDGTVTNPSNGGQYNQSYTASPVKPGPAFIAGVAAVRSISSRTSLSAGINYKYFSTSMLTGQRISNGALETRQDSIGVGTSNKYNSRYHFIELPLEIQSQFLNGKLPLYVSAAFTPAILVSSNTLQLQNQTGRYYSDNSFLNKLQLGVSAGVAVNVLNKKHAPLLVGPSLYYSFTPVAGKGLYNNTHYSFLGVRVQKQLGKK
ncbi:MAG: outer membrane beta-barrel protein [Ferruginibacter sp.]